MIVAMLYIYIYILTMNENLNIYNVINTYYILIGNHDASLSAVLNAYLNIETCYLILEMLFDEGKLDGEVGWGYCQSVRNQL